MYDRITSKDLFELIHKESAPLIDIRPPAAYNGWKLQDEARGGHIPGAISFPDFWLVLLDEDALGTLKERGMTTEDDLIVTGYRTDDAYAAADRFQDLGFTRIRIHEGGVHDWAKHPDRPLESLPRYPHLVHPRWLAKVLEGGQPEHPPQSHAVVAHVNYDNPDDYHLGHIPGAIWLNTVRLEEPGDWNCRPPEELDEALRAHGITKDTTVILTGRTGRPSMTQEKPGMEAGHLAAMRAALLLMYAGVEDVRVLDGGLGEWTNAGFSLSTKETSPTSVDSFGVNIPAHPEYIADMEEARKLTTDSKGVLVSMRSWSEYIGDASGYHYVEPMGRIPGAVFGDCGSDAYHMENYRNPDNTMQTFTELASRWKENGITPDKRVAFYCGTGWRASEAFFYAWLMDWQDVAVYDGGWYEWSEDPDNEIESGVPE